MNKKWITAALGAAALLGLWGCSSKPDTMVYVENVGDIVGFGSIAVNDKFAGVVVSDQVTEIQKDTSRTVSKLYVSEGQSVDQGDVLFEYDSESLQLELDKQELELEKLQQNSTTLQSQISKLTSEQKKASKDDQLSYTIEIQSKEAEKKENDYNIKVKQKEISKTKSTLANAEVLSPVSGRVVTISETGMDNYGNPQAYISIQQTGTYRVKGIVNEMNMGTIYEGVAVRITSRQDAEQTWTGVVEKVDLESTVKDDSNSFYYYESSNEMTSTSKYPFYVTLDNADGLMLGQHVYLEVDNGGTSTKEGLWLPEYYLCYDEAEEGEESQAYVWAANSKDRLEKRYVTLGSYDEMMMTYEILDGLTVEDYIAFPDETCVSGAGATQNRAEATPITEDPNATGDIWGEEDGVNDVQDPDASDEPTADVEQNGVVDGNGFVDSSTAVLPSPVPDVGNSTGSGVSSGGTTSSASGGDMVTPGTASSGNMGG